MDKTKVIDGLNKVIYGNEFKLDRENVRDMASDSLEAIRELEKENLKLKRKYDKLLLLINELKES